MMIKKLTFNKELVFGRNGRFMLLAVCPLPVCLYQKTEEMTKNDLWGIVWSRDR